MDAFYDLSAGRSVGELPQPITTSDIQAYCELFRIGSLEERDRLFRMIRRLDGAFLTFMTKKLAPST